ncbi:MAG: DUF7309 domain-containing protein [Candidatus Binatia bacterium]
MIARHSKDPPACASPDNDGMKIPSCSLSVWKNLYEVANTFRDAEPWRWMWDADLFGVQNPQSGEIGYCCVLGQLGEVFGLVVYLGTKGLEQHRKIQSGKIHPGSLDMAYNQHCLTAWFGDRKDLDEPDREVVSALGLKWRRTNSWPQFRSLQPGYLPWYLSEDEANYLALSLEQALEIALQFARESDLLVGPSKNHYLVRVPVKEPAGWRWESRWLKPAPTTMATVRCYHLDEVRLQRIKRTSQALPCIWEVDAYYTPMPVDGDNRPFFPYSLLCADHDSGLVFGTALAQPSTWETEFPTSLLDCMENHNFMPRVLWLRKKELRELFEPLASRLGIQVQVTKKLPAVDRAKRAMFKFLTKRPYKAR